MDKDEADVENIISNNAVIPPVTSVMTSAVTYVVLPLVSHS